MLESPQVLEDDELEPSGKNEMDSILSALSTPEDQDPREIAPLRLGSEIRRLQGDPIRSPTTLERIHRAALRKKEEKIMDLQETVAANKEKFDDLQT